MDRERAVAIMAGASDVDYSDWAAARRYAANAIKELQEYKDAEEKGLLIRIPCAIGTTLYCPQPQGEVLELQVSWIEVESNGQVLLHAKMPGGDETGVDTYLGIMVSDIGKKVFFSWEEALEKC